MHLDLGWNLLEEAEVLAHGGGVARRKYIYPNTVFRQIFGKRERSQNTDTPGRWKGKCNQQKVQDGPAPAEDSAISDLSLEPGERGPVRASTAQNMS